MGMTSVRGEQVQAQLQLDALQSITDVILAHLGLEDLLHELFLRIRQILRDDSSVILLKKGDMLETRSAVGLVGLEEEVERGVRIPIGRGFAGRIAATGQPMTIKDVGRAGVFDPILREKGGHRP